MAEITTIDGDLEAAEAAISGVIGSTYEAGKIVAEMCRRHNGFIAALHERLRGAISVAYLRRLERCGNREIHPRLVACVGEAQVWVEKLSYQDQETVVTRGVRWPLENGDHRIMQLSDLSYNDAKALFYGGVINSDETVIIRVRKWQQEREAKHRAKRAGWEAYKTEEREHMAWMESHGVTVDGDKIVIPRGVRVPLNIMATFLYKNGH